jgi:predicted phosphoadenosine phosphosulfate sulfurtransferase
MPYGLAKLEPETYNQLEKRLKGVHTAAIFGKENLMYSIKSLQHSIPGRVQGVLLNSIHPDLKQYLSTNG